MIEAISWSAFNEIRPDLAQIGHEMFYAFDVGLGFLATVRADGGPRVHPVCPIFVGGRLYVMVIPGPKLQDLKRDPRYALHSETFPPPREDDGFYVTGVVEEVGDPTLLTAIADEFFAERPGTEKWPGFDDQVFYELHIDRALLTLTTERDGFSRGSTVWRVDA
jgi:hypothetical protein